MQRVKKGGLFQWKEVHPKLDHQNATASTKGARLPGILYLNFEKNITRTFKGIAEIFQCILK